MKYAMCPKCGRRLCKGENGTKVEMECPKCGEFASVIIEEDDIHISKKPIFKAIRVFMSETVYNISEPIMESGDTRIEFGKIAFSCGLQPGA